MMKAVYFTQFGSFDNLELREVECPPKPIGNHVLVRIRAAGLNRADLLQVRGAYPPPLGYNQNIPGLEFAGDVKEVGSDVSSFSIGDRVFGITAGEAQAEIILSHESLLMRIPDNLSFAEAAAIPEAFITAHDAVFSQGKLQKHESLLIHAIGSGVGLAALQMAKVAGAFVIGTSRTQQKLDRCDEFGLDVAINTDGALDFSPTVLEKTGKIGADVILDLVGAAYFQQNLESLSVKGRLLLVGLTSGAKSEFDLRLALQKRATIIGTTLRGRSIDEKAEATRRFGEEFLLFFLSGEIRPNLDQKFPASDVIDAYKYLASNESFGKVVLEF